MEHGSASPSPSLSCNMLLPGLSPRPWWLVGPRGRAEGRGGSREGVLKAPWGTKGSLGEH